MDERRTAGSDTETTDTSCGSAASGGVCEQRHAAERVLPQSGFGSQHSGSPSEEAAMEEKEEKRSRWWPVSVRGTSRQETGEQRIELQAGRDVVGRTQDRSARRF